MEKCYQRLLLALCVLLGLAVAATEQARALTLFPVAASPGAITAGPDGALWFTGDNIGSNGVNGLIGRITTAGAITEFPIPTGVYRHGHHGGAGRRAVVHRI